MKAHQLRPKRTAKHSLRLRLAPAALLLCALGGCATDKEKQTATATPDRFAMADANHDGKLSQNEASDFIAGQIFDAKDTQKKGSVTEQEWAAGDPAAAANFKKQDTNHDGVLTKQESLQYNRSAGTAKKAFNAADTNHDGSLDRAEVQSYYGDREGSPF